VLAVVASTPAHGLRFSQEGNEPVSPANYADWPGLADVVNDESRVLLTGGTGIQEAFYRGDPAALARTLRAFAATAVEERTVILRPGRGKFSKPRMGSAFYDWKLSLVRGRARELFKQQDAELVWDEYPTLTVYTGGDVDLETLRIPKGITQLVGTHELRERYLRGIRSPNVQVRRYSLHLLAEADPYGAKSAAAVAGLSTDEAVRSAVENALAELKTRADDPADVQLRHKAEVRRIRQFVFDWRYPWLKVTLGLLLVVATVLLAVTLSAVWARRRRRREPRREA